MNFKKYLRVWYLSTTASIMVDLSKRFSALLLLLGKGIRLILFASFLVILLSGQRQLAGYSLNQAMIFFLTFNLVDTLAQIFLRGAYYFRNLVLRGDLDYILVHPLNSLFSVLFAHTDILDFVMFWPILLALVFSFWHLPGLTLFGGLIYFLLVVNGLLLAIGFHILVISLAITTYEVDNSLMIYRDLSSLGRVPVDLYREPIRFLITFVLPVGIMVTFPVKALMGLLSPVTILVALAVSLAFFSFSLWFWQRSLKLYSSASS